MITLLIHAIRKFIESIGKKDSNMGKKSDLEILEQSNESKVPHISIRYGIIKEREIIYEISLVDWLLQKKKGQGWKTKIE